MENHKPTILVVDDEPEIRRFLRVTLNANQFEVYEAETGLDALIAIRKRKPDLMILDLGLPDMDGVEVARRTRLISQLPIIILSVRDREIDKVQALDIGADDYLTKPFGVGELLARIRVVMRHTPKFEGESIYSVKDLMMDVARHQVFYKEKEIELTPNEFDILRILLQNAGRVITHRMMIREVWGTYTENDNRMLRVNISNLRKKIEPDPNQPHYILTELGVGYRLKD
jgi:two-component system, OmpR family, KDP operon response regulator KdpE